MKTTRNFWSILTMLIVASMALAACGAPATEAPAAPAEQPTEAPAEPTAAPEEPTAAPEEAMPEVSFDVMPGGALEEAIKGTYAGTTVTVDGAFEGNDADGVKFNESMKAFQDATGITVNYVGSKEFEGSIAVRVDAGDAPDIVDFPQPGLFGDFVRSGDIVPVTDFISEDWLSRQYNPGWREFNTVDGVEAGVMHRYSGKSLVWYPKASWDAAGYEIPQTWDDLLALTQQIADDGDTAWCIGIESGAATGWVATDWTEDLMLRTTSLENYDAWVAGDLPFDSPEVKNAIETWSNIWFNDAYVYGGRSSIVSTAFGDAPGPMFEDPPKCWLHRQANFITSFFPEGTTYGVDYDFFYLPPVDEQYGKPFLVAGDLIAMFNDRPEVRALMEYFTTPQSVSGWLEGGGAIAAQQTATQDMYGSDLDWGVSQLVAGATSFRFDGSDLMPGEVGAGSFWEHITSYVAGSEDLDTAMQAIDASWPGSIAANAHATEESNYFYDDFSDNSNGWDTGSYESDLWVGSRTISNGVYIWDATEVKNSFFHRGTPPNRSVVEDFYLGVDAKLVSGNPAVDCYGLFFRHDSSRGSYYRFSVCDNQRFRVYYYDGNSWESLNEWIDSSTIQPGDWNRIEVIAVGSDFEFYINNVLIEHISDSRLTSGYLGFAIDVSEPSQIWFDNLEMTTNNIQFNAEAKANAQATENAKYFYDDFSDNSNGWETGSEDNDYWVGSRSIQSGAYQWNITEIKKSFFHWQKLPTFQSVQDFHITVDGKLINGNSSTLCFGVLFRRDSSKGSYYAFSICDSQRYRIQYYTGTEWEYLIDWTDSSIIRSGDWNEIEVVAKGDQFECYINNQKVEEISDTHLTKGYFGLLVDSNSVNPGQIWFDNLEFELR